MQTLGDCCALVRKEFPSIDDVLFEYIESILETSGDDFETEEDIFDAIGGVLQEVDQTKTEDSIKTICNKIRNVLRYIKISDFSFSTCWSLNKKKWLENYA